MKKSYAWLGRALMAGALAAGGTAAAQQLQPYNVTVTYNAAANSATVNWQADAPAAYGYSVQRRPVGRTTWTEVRYASEPSRSFTNTGLAPLTRYEYKVVAFRPGSPPEGYSSGVVATRLDFPYAPGYGRGILPNNFTRGDMNTHVASAYSAWRARYITSSGAPTGMKRVYKPLESAETVSEGQGYGMLISAYMDNGSNGGKADFDALFKYYNAKKVVRSDGTRDLMAWRISSTGTVASSDNMSATDGDLDAAYALLVADKKWGSNGAIDYKAEAIKIINALMDHNVLNRSTTASGLFHGRDKPLLTDQEWSTDYTFSSYQMAGYIEAFAKVSDATRAAKWRAMKPELYKLYHHFYNLQANGTSPKGLFPFTFMSPPGPTQYGQSPRGYNFGFDACRVPWRVATDFLWHGTATAVAAQAKYAAIPTDLARLLTNRQVDWYFGAIGGSATTSPNPQLTYESYELDGTVTPGKGRNGQRNFVSAMAVGAMTDSSNQAFLNILYDWMRKQTPGASYTDSGVTINENYYSDSVLMVTMLMVTGNMPNLAEVPVPAQ